MNVTSFLVNAYNLNVSNAVSQPWLGSQVMTRYSNQILHHQQGIFNRATEADDRYRD